ncbi:MAG TPA: TetR/AcrR family transcriptional regulator [Solirubrobacterales bacterium]|jgi:AcrR family transcriptional regulator|nr:TetR/AcrR family transcriptional regulator [Solirubrobacterales bacterium]
MAAHVETPSTRERICEAALLGFAEDGVAATSIRDVAAAAGVSPGLVQHHFTTKDKLREAVNEYVVTRAAETFADLPSGESSEEIQRELGDRVTGWAREHPEALLYVARLSADEDPSALEIFDAFLAIANRQWRRLAEEGVLRPDLDIEWASLQAIVLILGSALFEGAISRHLPKPWRDAEQLERWNRASSELFRRGLYSEGDGR